MLTNLLNITSTIEELNDKLNKIVDGYIGDPFIGFLVFIILLIIGVSAVSSFNSK